MKLKHPTLRSTKTVASVGAIDIDSSGLCEVTEEQAKHLLTCGFKHHEEKPLFPVGTPVKTAPTNTAETTLDKSPPAVIVPPPPPDMAETKPYETLPAEVKSAQAFEELVEEDDPTPAARPSTTPPASPKATERKEQLKKSNEKLKSKK